MKKFISFTLSLLLVLAVVPMTMASADEVQEKVYNHISVFDANIDGFYGEKARCDTEIVEDTIRNDESNSQVLKVNISNFWDRSGLTFPIDSGALIDSVGIRMWIAGDPDAQLTNAVSLGFGDSVSVDGSGIFIFEGVGYTGSQWAQDVTTEGGWYEIYWDTLNTSSERPGKLGEFSSRGPSWAYNAHHQITEDDLAFAQSIAIAIGPQGYNSQYNEKNYYIDDIQIIKPYIVSIDGEKVGSGAKGEKVKLPENEDILGYSDGDKLYAPGEEFVIDEDIDLITIVGEIGRSDFNIENSEKEYTGSEIVTDISSETVPENNYSVTYDNNINIGTATITITASGHYFGTVTETFEITQKTISDEDFKFDLNSKTYTGKEIEPKVTSANLKAEDYIVTYQNNINKGIAVINVSGQGNCKGEVSKEFEIVEKAIEETDFEFDLANKTYTGSAIEPQVKSTLAESDYEVTYENNVNVGTAKVILTGKGNYIGTISKEFKIVEKAIDEANFEFDLTDKTYTGSAIEPQVKSTLTESDYEVTYENNVNAGTAVIKVTGKGNYIGTISKEFKIAPKDLIAEDFEAIADTVYANKNIEPKIAAINPLVTENDYNVEYSNNKNVGEATVTVTGSNNFTGTVVLHFNITVKEISEDDFTVDTDNKVYVGEAIEPEVKSILDENDYTVAYENNVNVGTATITITGKGNAVGKITKEFKIVEKAIDEENFEFDLTDKTYTGSAIEPQVKSTLTESDYEVTYENNVNVGTAVVKVTGKGNYTGEIIKTYVIKPQSISANMFTVDTKTVNYTGKAITKSIKSALNNKTDYTVSYKNNKNVGKATITITGKGNFTGTVTKTFKINVPKVGNVKKVTVAAGKKKATVRYNKVKGANGYVIKISTKKNFKGKTSKTVYVKNYKTAKKVVTKLSSNKKYYVKVAAYRNYKNSKNKTVKAIGKFKSAKKPIKIK